MALKGSVETNHFSDSSVNETYIQFNWNAEQNQTGNYSTVTWEIVLKRPDTSNYVYVHNFNRTVYGSYDLKGTEKYYNNSVIDSGSFVVEHNASTGKGSFSISMFANIYYSSGGAISAEETFTLDTIPRYATSVQSLRSKTTNSITMNWSSDSTIDYIWYSKDNGSSWTGIDVTDGKSGTYTIANLSPNTTYKIKTKVRRKDSQLTTESSVLSVATYDIARLTNYPNFNLGDDVTISFSNPSGELIQVGIYDNKGEKGYAPYRKASGSSYTFKFTDEELDNMYKEMSKNSLPILFYIKTGTVNSDNKSATVNLTGNQKTGHVNVNNSWKRSKRWINVNGTWERCVRWINVNGTWRRCI